MDNNVYLVPFKVKFSFTEEDLQWKPEAQRLKDKTWTVVASSLDPVCWPGTEYWHYLLIRDGESPIWYREDPDNPRMVVVMEVSNGH